MKLEPSTARVAELDGIRGLAVLIVIVHNAAWIGAQPRGFASKLFESAAAAGWVGVQLFFVLSGLLITGILADSVDTPLYFRRFYLRRALRIAPLYYVVLVAILLTAALMRHPPSGSAMLLREQWLYWLYLSNWSDPFGHSVPMLSHVWSLAVEEQFYLVWPVLVYALRRRQLVWLTAVLIVGGPLIRLALHGAGLPSNALYTFTVARWDALATGALLALAFREPSWRTWLFAHNRRLAWALIGIAVPLALHQRGFHDGELPVQVWGQSIVAGLSAVSLVSAVSRAHRPITASRMLANGLLPHIGQYSYAMYLLHIPLHRMLEPHLTSWVNGGADGGYLWRELAYCALVLGLAYTSARVSWVIVERPFLMLKDRFAPPHANPVPLAGSS